MDPQTLAYVADQALSDHDGRSINDEPLQITKASASNSSATSRTSCAATATTTFRKAVDAVL